MRLVGGTGFLHAVEREASTDPYTITALVAASEKDGGHGHPAARGRHRLSGRDRGPVRPCDAAGGFDRTGGPSAPGRDRGGSGEPEPVRHGHRDPRHAARSRRVRVPDRRHGPALRRSGDRRVLRHHASGVLPVVRLDDGRLPARSRDPGPLRPGLPAGHAGRERRRPHRAQLRRARLGPGLLPGLRLGRLQPDRRTGGGPGADPVRSSRGVGHAWPVLEQRGRTARSDPAPGDRRARRGGWRADRGPRAGMSAR